MASRSVPVSTALLVVLMAFGASWAYAHLPTNTPIPIHFSADGTANGWGSPITLFLLPGIAAITWMLLWALPRIDPRGSNIVRSPAAYGTVWFSLIVLLALVEAILMSAAFGVDYQPGTLFPFLTAGLLIVVGNVMGKMRWNTTVGIRTPWALVDERVWDKTQRFGGRMMVVAGLVVLVAALVPTLRPHMGVVVIASVLLAVAASFLQSYLYWRNNS